MIPVEHGRNAHRIVAHSRYVEIEGSGHWPMLDASNRVVGELTSFIEKTEPFQWSLERSGSGSAAVPTAKAALPSEWAGSGLGRPEPARGRLERPRGEAGERGDHRAMPARWS